MNRMKLKGFTLVDLTVSIAIGATLLLAVSNLHQLINSTSKQVTAASDVYATGFQAIDYLKANMRYAGANFVFPTPVMNQNMQSGGQGVGSGSGSSCGFNGPTSQAGKTNWVAPGWTYLGMFADNVNRMYANSTNIYNCPHIFLDCGTWMNDSNPDSEYMELQYNYQCSAAAPGVSKNIFYNPPYGQNIMGSQAVACSDVLPHNCGGCWQNDVYQKLIPHVVVTPNTPAAWGDIVSITFAVQSGSNNLTDCLGNPVIAPPPADPFISYVPVRVNNVFRVNNTNNTYSLQCQTRTQTNGVWTAMSAWTDIVPNIEHMRVMVGLNDNVVFNINNNEGWDGVGNHRYAIPTDTNPLTAPPTFPPFPSSGGNPYPPNYSNPAVFMDMNRIVSLRLALVARSSTNVLSAPTAQNFTVFNRPQPATTYTSSADLLQRKLFTTTIFLENFTPPPYPAHCVATSTANAKFYVKNAGIPWVNSATATDSCYPANQGGNTCAYYQDSSGSQQSLNDCEIDRNNRATNYGWPPGVRPN